MPTRRDFLKNTAVLLLSSIWGAKSWASSINKDGPTVSTGFHRLPDLSYSYDALEPYISARIMEIHHRKHHQAYVDNLNQALIHYPGLQKKSVEELLRDLSSIPAEIQDSVRLHAGGHANHSLFWQIMSPCGGGKPDGMLEQAIRSSFGSVEALKEGFFRAAQSVSSGWAWVVSHDGKLDITITERQDSPISKGQIPILCLDVWKNAYFLDYRECKVKYIQAWWNIVNWQEVERRLSIAGR